MPHTLHAHIFSTTKLRSSGADFANSFTDSVKEKILMVFVHFTFDILLCTDDLLL